jgi:hypothetical protein
VVLTDRVDCLRDTGSRTLSVFAGRADRDGAGGCGLSLLLTLLLLLLPARLLTWTAVGMAVVLAEVRPPAARKNPGAGRARVGVDPARRWRSSVGLGAASSSGDDSVPFWKALRTGSADGRTTACIGDIAPPFFPPKISFSSLLLLFLSSGKTQLSAAFSVKLRMLRAREVARVFSSVLHRPKFWR